MLKTIFTMGDNLKLTLHKDDVETLIKSMDIGPSEYCVLATEDAAETILITTNDGLKLLLVENYGAKEISDWHFNEEYQRNKKEKAYSILGEGALIDKGY